MFLFILWDAFVLCHFAPETEIFPSVCVSDRSSRKQVNFQLSDFFYCEKCDDELLYNSEVSEETVK